MDAEVKYLACAVVLFLALVAIVGMVDASHFSVCSPACNTTVIWWNDTVNLTGTGGAAVAVTARVNGVTACATTTAASGNWNCNFIGPQSVGDYNLSVAVGSTVDDLTLSVRPSYGEKPTGSASRFVLEIPSAIQEPSGRLITLLTRLTISRGPTGT